MKTPWTAAIETIEALFGSWSREEGASLSDFRAKDAAYRQGVWWTLESEAVSGLRVALEHLVRDLPDPRDAQEGKKALAALKRLREEAQE